MPMTVSTESSNAPRSIAQCSCCGSVYTRAEWQALPTRRPWKDFDLEIAPGLLRQRHRLPIRRAV